MAWYYVKSGGTATGDGGRTTTQRTGTWSVTASEYYDEIGDAVGATTVPTDGDFILVSDLHSKTGAAAPILNAGGATTGAGLQIISVDNANQDQYKPGATEECSSSGYAAGNNGLIAGIDLEGENNAFAITASDYRFWSVKDSVLSTNTGRVQLLADGACLDLVNVDIDIASSIQIANGGRIWWRGGTWTSGATVDIINADGANAGLTIYIEGVDLSACTGSLFDGTPSAATTDAILVKLTNCQINSSLTLPSDVFFKLPQQRFEMWGCDDSTGDDLHRYHMQDGTGKVVNNDAKFVTADTVWYGGSAKSSYEVSTTALCSHVHPFTFDLPIEYVDLAAAASDIVRVALTTSLTLTDTEIAAFLVYPDGTTNVQPNWVTSGKSVGTGNYGVDPLDAGATLTTSSTAWTGALANKYQIDCDTTGDVGAASPVAVRIEIYRASITNTQLFIALEYEFA